MEGREEREEREEGREGRKGRKGASCHGGNSCSCNVLVGGVVLKGVGVGGMNSLVRKCAVEEGNIFFSFFGLWGTEFRQTRR